jgi:CBS domain-containing protein
MLERGVTGCPVIDWQGRALGIVSLTDIVDPDRPRSTSPGVDVHFQITDGKVTGFGTGLRVAGGSVDELMTAATISLHPEDSVEDAAELMVFNRIHRVLVNDGERVVGIISTLDITRHFTELSRGGRAPEALAG